MTKTLDQVTRDLKDFPYELQLYCYHKMNGRLDEAESYLNAYKEAQQQRR